MIAADAVDVSFAPDARCPELGPGQLGICLNSSDGFLFGTLCVPTGGPLELSGAPAAVVLVFVDRSDSKPIAFRLAADKLTFRSDEEIRQDCRFACFRADPRRLLARSGTSSDEPDDPARRVVSYWVVASVASYVSEVVQVEV